MPSTTPAKPSRSKKIIEKLGGIRFVAAQPEINKAPSTVQGWCDSGYRTGIPDPHHAGLLKLARRLGVSLTKEELQAARRPDRRVGPRMKGRG